MTGESRWVGHLITKIQNDFLETPSLKLRAGEIEDRFNIDSTTCDALLDVLTDAKVLARDRQGLYHRYVPRVSRRLAA